MGGSDRNDINADDAGVVGWPIDRLPSLEDALQVRALRDKGHDASMFLCSPRRIRRWDCQLLQLCKECAWQPSEEGRGRILKADL